MIRVLYAGDGSIRLETEVKGAEVTQYVSRVKDAAQSLREALGADPGIQVTHFPPHLAFMNFPATADELRRQFDTVILSDIGSETLTTWPLDEGHPLVPKPNRMRELTRFVKEGGGLIYAGGYMSFQGRGGTAHWFGSALAESLPVEILNVVDDREDTPEGVRPTMLNTTHPITRDIPWNECPIFFGYNKCKAKPGADLLGTIEDYPFLIVGNFGKARVMVFTSDPCPHWGEYFSRWPYYSQFWRQAVRWVAGQ
jgi:uncharacterized membrane protein